MNILLYILRITNAVFRKLMRITGCRYKLVECYTDALKNAPKEVFKSSALTRDQIKQYREKWKPLSGFIPSVYLKRTAFYTGKVDLNVVPWHVYYMIVEPILNDQIYSAVFEDKSHLDWIHGEEYVPLIYIRNIHGTYFSSNKQSVARDHVFPSGKFNDGSQLIVKKSLGEHGGRGVVVFEWDGLQYVNEQGDVLSLDYLELHFKENFIVQEYVTQHPYYAAFNSSSVNCLRIVTYRSVLTNQIYVLSTILKIGASGGHVDNIKQGGTAVAVDKDGRARKSGITGKGIMVTEVGNSRISLSELGVMEGYQQICEAAVELAGKHYYSRLLGFDLAYDASGEVKLIEVNNFDLGAAPMQDIDGGLFGEFTNEVIDYCQKELTGRHNYQIYNY
jgi:hypothetical protein